MLRSADARNPHPKIITADWCRAPGTSRAGTPDVMIPLCSWDWDKSSTKLEGTRCHNLSESRQAFSKAVPAAFACVDLRVPSRRTDQALPNFSEDSISVWRFQGVPPIRSVPRVWPRAIAASPPLIVNGNLRSTVPKLVSLELKSPEVWCSKCRRTDKSKTARRDMPLAKSTARSSPAKAPPKLPFNAPAPVLPRVLVRYAPTKGKVFI